MTRMPRYALALAVIMVPFASHAASFDCAKAATPVEKAICASPAVSALDGQLADAFRVALGEHPGQADALKQDQARWLGERDDRAWAFLSDDVTRSHAGPVLATAYQERIAFLRGLGAAASPPMDVIRAGLPAGASIGGDPFAYLAGNGQVVVDRETEVARPDAFRLKPDRALSAAMADASDATLTDRVLEGAAIGSLFTLQGTAHCWEEMPYLLAAGEARSVSTPGAWDGSDCMSAHHLVKVGDTVAAIQYTSTPSSLLILANAWEGTRFGATEALALRFDTTLSVTGAACAPAQSPCDDFGAAALAIATRYARRPLPGTLGRPPGSIPARDATAGPLELPSFGARLTDGMTSYGSEATSFPIVFRGETLLGYIGHAHAGWRDDANWLVSAWRVKNGKLEPVAGAHITVARGNVVLSAMVPAPPIERH